LIFLLFLGHAEAWHQFRRVFALHRSGPLFTIKFLQSDLQIYINSLESGPNFANSADAHVA
jgi:hypothetical protein